jgi:hypothetical protein
MALRARAVEAAGWRWSAGSDAGGLVSKIGSFDQLEDSHYDIVDRDGC